MFRVIILLEDDILMPFLKVLDGLLMSLLVPSPAGSPHWTEWSYVWRKEMELRRALEKLNLKYLADSD